MFKVKNRLVIKHPSSIASWVARYDGHIIRRPATVEITQMFDLFRPELMDWLRGRHYSAWWHDGPNGVCWVGLEFKDKSDGLLFKLTWCGK